MKRGDIFLADLYPRSGAEQSGRRPVLVFSHDSFNRIPGWRSVIVVPFSTSPRQARRGLTAVAVPAGEGGLDRESVALCHQVTTLDRSKLDRKLGVLSPKTLSAVEFGVKASLGLR